MTTQNGRPAQLGSVYWENLDGGGRKMRFCMGYCPKCGHKFGLTKEEMNKLEIPNYPKLFLLRLLKAKILIPK